VRVGREAKQARALSAQLQDLPDDRVVVAGITVVATVDEGAPDLFAQIAARGVGEERLDGRARIGHDPFAFFAATLGITGKAGAQRIGQAGEIVGVVEHEILLALVAQQILTEAREEAREALIDFTEALLGRRIEFGTGTNEVRVDEPGEALLFGSEAARFTCLVDLGDTREQLFVLRDAITECRHLRLDIALDLLNGIVAQ